MKFGIVGYGRFGKLWAQALLPLGTVLVHEKSHLSQNDLTHAGIQLASLAEVTQADVVFLLVPISEMERSCQQIKDLLAPNTIVVDCCSVKVHPVAIMQKNLAQDQPIISTHPLFGPDSVKKSGSMQGHKLVFCPIRCTEIQKNALSALFEKMGLTVMVSTPEEHDMQMASSQGLVHFIGRGLAALDLKPQELATPDFEALLNINNMVVNDTWRLFLDMHQYNPYAKNIRKKFIHQLTQLEKAIEDGKA